MLEESSPWLKKAASAHKELFGRGPNIDKWTFSTNGVGIMPAYGIPCLGFGPGSEPQAHAVDEYCPVEDLTQAAAFYAALAAELGVRRVSLLPYHGLGTHKRGEGAARRDRHAGLDVPHAQAVVRKGYHAHTDSYSALLEADRATPTGLAGMLRERAIRRVYVCGLATDFCVAFSAIDAQAAGFETWVIEDACRAIDTGGSLAAAGINAATSSAFISLPQKITLRLNFKSPT